jgi:hypothetical protein
MYVVPGLRLSLSRTVTVFNAFTNMYICVRACVYCMCMYVIVIDTLFVFSCIYLRRFEVMLLCICLASTTHGS